MAPTDDLQEIRNSVGELARRGGITPNRAFAAWYVCNFFDIDEDEALEAAGLDSGEDQGIDLLCLDKLNERVIILQAHFPDKRERAAPKAKFDGLTSAIPWIESPEAFRTINRPDLVAAAEEVLPYLKQYEVLTGVVSLGRRSPQIENSVATCNKTTRFKPFHFFYESVDSILDRYAGLKASEEGVPTDTLTFEGARWYEDAGAFGRAWVGSITAKEMNRLYAAHKDRLFERNVRKFLGTRKGGINEQIVQTAKSEPGKFWALNNGITIVADTIEPTSKTGTFRLTRFSVVNGCQTTVCLARAEAPEGAKILVRIVAANRAVVNDIVRYNNTQNAVRIWTVRAADDVQQRLRASFKHVGVEYAPKPGNRRVRSEPTRVIELDRLAQYLASRADLLTEAVKEKSELFDRHYQAIFPHDVAPEEVYVTWLLGVLADEERQQRLDTLRRDGQADKVLLALLSVAGTYWTVYCASRFIETRNKRLRPLDLTAIQSKEFQNALRKYVREGLDSYLELAGDAYAPEEYPTVRQALRSPKFCEKVDRKLTNRIARWKGQEDRKLPDLVAAAKTAKVTSKS